MKIGDKVHCIRNRYSIDLSIIHTIGKKYTLIDMNINTNIILVQSNDSYYEHCIFYFKGFLNHNYIFKDYFITNEEMRNLKIKKLKNVESR